MAMREIHQKGGWLICVYDKVFLDGSTDASRSFYLATQNEIGHAMTIGSRKHLLGAIEVFIHERVGLTVEPDLKEATYEMIENFRWNGKRGPDMEIEWDEVKKYRAKY